MARPPSGMRMRYLKPDFWKNEGLADLDDTSGLPCRLAYLGLCGYACEFGRFSWNPRRIGAEIFRYQPQHQLNLAKIMELLSEQDYIRKYRDADGKEYGYFPHWDDHYRRGPKSLPSICPDPDSCELISINPRLIRLIVNSDSESESEESKCDESESEPSRTHGEGRSKTRSRATAKESSGTGRPAAAVGFVVEENCD